MPLDFDPVFHTETMVKILREQGSTQYATELAELILQKNPDAEGVRRLLEELREESRRAFERFKNSGRPIEAETSPIEAPLELGSTAEAVSNVPELENSAPASEEVPTEPTHFELVEASSFESEDEVPVPEPVRLTLVPSPPLRSRRENKIRRLEALLRRVQSFRKASDAPQA